MNNAVLIHISSLIGFDGPGWRSRYRDSLRAGEVFCTLPDRPWGPSGLLNNGYRVFPGVKWPGRDIDHQSQSSSEVKERVGLHLLSTSGP